MPSIIRVLVCRFGFQTFLVCRWEKLTLLPNCLPLPLISLLCIGRNCICFWPFGQGILKGMDFSSSDIIVIIVAILFSMGLHEAMHAFTAHWLGDTTASDMGRLTLNPLKHIDLFTTVLLPVVLILIGAPPIFAAKPVPFNPARVKYDEYGAALIGISGPLTNLALAFAAAGILKAFGLPSGLTEALVIFTMVNIGFFVFNMIPLPPLDGSRLLYAFAPEPLQKIMYEIESMGFGMLLLLLIILIPIIGPFISNISSSLLILLLG